MCMQCMATAMTSGAAVTGARSWLATRKYSWLTPQRLKSATVFLFASALVASSLLVSGSSQATAAHAAPSATAATSHGK